MLNVFATQSAADSGERLLNGYLRASAGKGAQAVILGRAGLVSSHQFGGPVRAFTVHKGSLYAVANGALWQLVSGTWTSKAVVPDGVTRIASGSGQIAIVVGGDYYVYNSTAETIAATTPGALTACVDVIHISGYFIVLGTHSGRDDGYIYSALDDATTFDALDFAFAEGEEDRLVGAIVDHLYVWLFGSKTTEKLYIGSAGPTPDQSAILEHGCADNRTIAKADNRVFWVDERRKVEAGSGATAQVISPRWVDDILASATITGGFVFNERGAQFYCVTLSGRPALVYDITTGLWHERSDGVEKAAWTAGVAEWFDGQQYIGTTGGNVCTPTECVYADAGTVFEFEAVSDPNVEADPIVVRRLQIITDGGQEDIGRAPQIMMQVSKDGVTWGRERWRNLAQLGEYGKVAEWHALGQSRYWQIRIRITDAVNRDIRGASYG